MSEPARDPIAKEWEGAEVDEESMHAWKETTLREWVQWDADWQAHGKRGGDDLPQAECHTDPGKEIFLRRY